MVGLRGVRDEPHGRLTRPFAGRWPLLPARTNATTQAASAMRALARATSLFEESERTASADDVTLLYADEVIRCRLRLYGMLERLGMRPAVDRDTQLWRDAELLHYVGPSVPTRRAS